MGGGRRLAWVVAVSIVSLSGLLMARRRTPDRGRGKGFSVQYDEPAALQAGIDGLRILESEAIARGYRRVSSTSHKDSSGAHRTETILSGDENHLSEVELVLRSWDRLRPDDPEVWAHVYARVPDDPTADGAWDRLESWVESRVRPSRLRLRAPGGS